MTLTLPPNLNQAGSAKTDAHVADAWVWPFVWQGNVSIFTAIFKAAGIDGWLARWMPRGSWLLS